MSERTRYDGATEVDALARRLARREPSCERSQAMRRALLEAANEPIAHERPRWSQRAWWIGGAALAAAAAAAWLMVHTPSAPAPSVASAPAPSAPAPGAPVVASSLPAPPTFAQDPVQGRLVDGVTAFKTTGLVQLERGGATITAPPDADFEVEVRTGQLQRITVRAGWVVVASAGASTKVVGERETWIISPPPPPPLAPPSPRPSRPAAVVVAPTPKLSVAPSRPELAPPRQTQPAVRPLAPDAERAFRGGMQSLLDGNPREAAITLERACAAPSGTQEDACYWVAVALARAGDRSRARIAFADVVARWPSSTHAGEANLALGWLLLEAGDRAGARARFTAALTDSLPRVRADAQRGITASQ